MVNHELYNAQGRLVHTVNLDVKTCEPLVIEHEGVLYKPICYEFGSPQIARCVPIKLVRV